MAAEFTSHLPEVIRRIEAATDAALIAAALVLVNAIKKKVTVSGYTSGAFRNTLLRRKHIRHSMPATEDGRRTIRVGVLSGIPVPPEPGKPPPKKKITVGEIMLAYELGHVNLFMGRYVRVEIFRTAANDSRSEMSAAAQRAFREAFAA